MDTRIYKTRDGWHAKTEADIGDGRLLVVLTSKRLNGMLISTANGWSVAPGGGMTHVMGFGADGGDFSCQVSACRPSRVTEKVVEHHHQLALKELETLKTQALAHYAHQERKQSPTEPANPSPWVLVGNAGTDVEDIVNDYATYAQAVSAQIAHGQGDVMKRLGNGTLTTEF